MVFSQTSEVIDPTRGQRSKLARFGVALATVISFSYLPFLAAQGQLSYSHTTFLNGFASDSTIWTTAYGEINEQMLTPPQYLSSLINLKVIDYPKVNDSLTYDQALARVVPQITSGSQRVFVGHSMGSLIARDIYIRNSALRQNFAGIIALAGPHQGTMLATNADEALRFFMDVQRRVNDGITAINIEAFVAFLVQWLVPSTRSIILPILNLVLPASWGAQADLGNATALPKLPALGDLKPASATIQSLSTNYSDGSLPRANIYGTIPHQNAVIRLFASGQGNDWKFNQYVGARNSAVTAFKVCKYVGYATIVLGSQGRKCAYAVKTLKRIDGRWVRYVNGTDAYGNPRYVPFDGVVANERQQYPTTTTLAYQSNISGLNHWNIYKRRSGLFEVATAMRRIGMQPVGGDPPPTTLTVSISGPDAVNSDWYSTWSAEVSGGTPPYGYGWSGLFYGSSSSVSGSTSASGNLVLDVYDAAGAHATATKFVTATGCSGQEIC